GLGISRSATIVLAYMLYQARPMLTPGGALFVLRSSRPGCQPNAGFTEQLTLYHQMGCPDSLEDQHLYQLFLNR
ncbi:tyrosine protein phosphatase yvh1, partial [Microsporum ferrugineum]